jgi:hypothetical protein
MTKAKFNYPALTKEGIGRGTLGFVLETSPRVDPIALEM